MNGTGLPTEVWLKDWLRLRGSGTRKVVDPGVFASVRGLSGSPTPSLGNDSVSLNVGLGSSGVRDVYYEGRVQQAGDEVMTPSGLQQLPVSVQIHYYVGAEGAEQEVPAAAINSGAEPQRFKIAITVRNNTERMQEITYNDIQSKKQVTAIEPVYTPFVARVVDLKFPDSAYDQITSDGDVARTGEATVVNWTLNLVPPDYPAEQTATVTGIAAKGAPLPRINVVAEPVYPAEIADALSSSGVQFERGRRNFFYDVFGLFRENLVALTGLFGLLDDAFGNLAIPILGPDKGNRESGSFDKPNQLWALWTLTKGMEQLDRAMNVLSSGIEEARDGTKGAIATLSAMRLFLGFSTDPAATNVNNLGNIHSANDVILNSVWSDVKELLQVCGDTQFANTQGVPYFPTMPAVVTPLCPGAELTFNLLLLKLALMEHDLHSIQKENHNLDTALIAGLSNLPGAGGCSQPPSTAAGVTCDSFNKFNFIKFPFGLEEIERGLYTLKIHGFDPLQAAMGNKDTPNSLIWALNVLTDGAEAQIDSYHQLGATWRYLADSVQNFGIFGVDTSQSLLQLDVNAIDINSGIKAAAVARAQEMATFMGRPTDPDGKPAVGQLVVSFSTGPVADTSHPTDTTGGRALVALSGVLILAVLFGFARFRWFLI